MSGRNVGSQCQVTMSRRNVRSQCPVAMSGHNVREEKKSFSKDGKVIMDLDDPTMLMDNVKNTPKYWQKARYKLNAKLENLGPFDFFFSRVHATLYSALSVRPSVRPSVPFLLFYIYSYIYS